MGQDGGGVVAQQNLALGPLPFDDGGVEIDVIHPGKGMEDGAELFPELLPRKGIPVGVHPGLIQGLLAHQVVAHLVGGVGEEEDNFFRPPGKAPQQDGKAVAAEDGEHHPDGLPPQLPADVGGDLVHRGVVPLGAGHHRLGDRHHILFPNGDVLPLEGRHHGIRHNGGQVVPLPDNGGPDPPHHSTKHSFHIFTPFSPGGFVF